MAGTGDIEADAKISELPTVSEKDYADLLFKLGSKIGGKDVPMLKFLCFEFMNDESFLEKRDLSARDIFYEMNRNGSLSPKKVRLLSQITYLIGKKRLQKTILEPKGIPAWRDGSISYISNFRLLLFKLYQYTRKEDLGKMVEFCSLRGNLLAADKQQVEDALDLFTKLINIGEIAEIDISYLKPLIDIVGSKKMTQAVDTYAETYLPKANKLTEEKDKKDGSIGGVNPQFSALRVTDTSLASSSATFNSVGQGNFLMKDKGSTQALLRPVDLSASLSNNTSRSAEYKDDFKLSALVQGACGGSESKDSKDLDSKTASSSGTEYQINATSNLDANPGKPSTAKLAKEECSKAYQPEETHKLQLESEQDTSSEDSLLTPEKLSATNNGFEIGSLAASVRNMDISMNMAASGDMEHAELPTSMESAKPGLKSSDLNMTVRSENTQKDLDKLKSTPNESKVSSSDSGSDSILSPVIHPVTTPVQRTDSEERYSMDQIPRGCCLILTYDKFKNHNARPGNEHDIEMLKELFEDVLEFVVVEKCNLTHAQTKYEIEQMAQKAYGDCFICFVCSHGDGKSFITSDDETFIIQDLFTPFKPLNCKALAGKPKIFFINTCLRSSGVEFQHFKVVESDDENELAADGEDGPESMGLTAKLSKLWADEGDFCVCLSTVPGYSSARQPKRGTIYVQHLYKCFKEKYMSEHLCDILTSVRRSTNQALKAEALKAEALKAEKKENDQKVPDPKTVLVCQVSPAITGLMKKVYFTSGNTKT
ncbi:uncharacterized protein [Apostichopus japonicus]|uniref:uncharacterized protein isoform X2 n=1 Tax=Stichopus japonicus TaxID=307972 RepID=UPI003AB2BFD4